MYLLWKEELLCTSSYGSSAVKEIILYHSTSSENARRIARDNIDWRKTKRSKYGKGACFARDPLYASYHSSAYGGRYIINCNFKLVIIHFSSWFQHLWFSESL